MAPVQVTVARAAASAAPPAAAKAAPVFAAEVAVPLYAETENRANLLAVLRAVLPARWPRARGITARLLPLLDEAEAESARHGPACPAVDRLLAAFRDLPVTTYADYRDAIQRMIRAGDPDVLAPGKPRTFAVTGGTTSNVKKYLPQYVDPALGKSDPPDQWSRLQRLPQISFIGKRVPEHAVDDTPVGQASAFFPTSPGNVTPATILYLEHYGNMLRFQALFGLAFPSVRVFLAVYINVIADFFAVVERHWDSLLANLEAGTLPSDDELDRPLPPEIRLSLQERWTAQPARAAHLRTLFTTSGSDAAGLMRRIWPDLQLLAANSSGPYVNFLNAVKHFAGPDVRVTSIGYGASEGFFARVVDPAENQFVIGNPDIYFEFLEVPDPSAADSVADIVVSMADLVPGRCYELVVTTANGLIRYRQGDVIRIEGWSAASQQGYLPGCCQPTAEEAGTQPDGPLPPCDAAASDRPSRGVRHGCFVGPTMSYVGRVDKALGINGAVMNESDLTAAMAHTGVPLREFAAFHDVSVSPPRFGVYVDLLEHPATADILASVRRRVAAAWDDFMMREVALYDDLVSAGRLQAPPVVHVVRPETFQHLRQVKALGEHLDGGGAPGGGFNQTKLPLAIHDQALLRLLQERIVP